VVDYLLRHRQWRRQRPAIERPLAELLGTNGTDELVVRPVGRIMRWLPRVRVKR
jgi:hypothetical protein